MKFDLRTWLFFNIFGDANMVLLVHYAFQPTSNQGAQFIYTLNVSFALGIAVITFLMFLMMDLDDRSHRYEKTKSGEASPYFKKEYETGRVVAYKNVIKIYHGSQRIQMTVNEFLTLANQIKHKYNNTLVENPGDLNNDS